MEGFLEQLKEKRLDARAEMLSITLGIQTIQEEHAKNDLKPKVWKGIQPVPSHTLQRYRQGKGHQGDVYPCRQDKKTSFS